MPTPWPRSGAGLGAILENFEADAIVVDTMFCGTFPLLLGPREHRLWRSLPSASSALPLSSCDTAFFGTALPPSSTPEGARNWAMNANLKQAMFGEVQRYFDALLTCAGLPALPDFFIDAMVKLPTCICS